MRMLKVTAFVLIEEKNPLKQGLKLFSSFAFLVASLIEEKNPLKQGLKQEKSEDCNSPSRIEEKNPLKQGLKHNMPYSPIPATL